MRGPATLSATVAICTANRSALLAESLAALLPLLDATTSEVLVVDNGSSDDTPRMLAELVAAHPRTVRAVREERPGLSAARNRAVREARGDLLLFLDDDAVPAPGWLEAYVTAFGETRAAAAGGPVEPIFGGALPDWLDDRFLPYLTAWDRGQEVVSLRYNELPRGANMGFRRALFEVYGDFLEQLQRKGSGLRTCEDIEFCLRLERGGEEILYLPNAFVRHHVAKQRLTVAWMGARFAGQGFSEAIIDWRHAGLRGLRTGLRRVARLPSSSADNVHAQCMAHSRRGYRRGALYALFFVSPYRPPGALALARFDPSS